MYTNLYYSNKIKWLYVSNPQSSLISVAFVVLKYGTKVYVQYTWEGGPRRKFFSFCIWKRGFYTVISNLLAHEKQIFFCLYRVAMLET